MASRMAFLRSLFLLRKNDTVMGIIGHTHGVNKARNPPNNPSNRIIHHEIPFASWSFPSKADSSLITGFHKSPPANDKLSATWVASSAFMGVMVSGVAIAVSLRSLESLRSLGSLRSLRSLMGDFPFCLMATVVGGIQLTSLQAPYSKYASISYSGLVNFTFCTKVAEPSKYFKSISNNLSYCLISFPTGFNLPTNSKPSILTTLNVASIGPSLPKSVE